MYIYIHILPDTYACVYIYIYTIHTYVRMCAYMYIYTYMMYMYICIYTYAYIYIYMYTHMFVGAVVVELGEDGLEALELGLQEAVPRLNS